MYVYKIYKEIKDALQEAMFIYTTIYEKIENISNQKIHQLSAFS